MRYLLVLLLILLPTVGGAQQLAFNPARTWVIAIGLLEWKDAETWAPFSKLNRRDSQLIKAFAKLGVASDHLVLLQDKAATNKAVRSTLLATLGKTRPGDTLVFYYAGHGYHDGKSFYLVPYDGYETDTLIGQKELTEHFERRFGGEKVLLVVDCCHSGALANWVKRGKHKKAYAALTSSKASESSTGNWTFSDCFLDALRGEAYLDENRDGQLSLAEVADALDRQMQFVDEQRARSQFSAQFRGRTPFVKASGVSKKGEGQLVRVKAEGSLWPARVVQRGPQGVLVHWLGNYENYQDAWVKANQIK